MIVVSEYIHEDALPFLDEHAEVVYDPQLYRDRVRLAEVLVKARALIVRNLTRVDATLLASTTKLQVVGRLGVGLDNLDLDVLRERGITVTWAPSTNAVSVVEYVFGVMLELSRRFVAVSSELHAGRWDRQAAIGRELYGKTLGIVGLGDIGGRLARRAQVFGMRVLASDPLVHDSALAVQEYGVTLVRLEELLSTADYVSLHAPLVPATRKLINERTLGLMREEAYLINTARGGLVDEEALAAALQAHKLAGAALDVRQQEPPEGDDPFKGLPNVILTPHIAGVTHESNRRASLHVAQDVLRVLRGEKAISVVT